jgi:transcriptional regulator with XRE-family HTH domain
MDIAQVVRTARKRSGLSLTELADMAGTSPQTILNIEQGKVSPRADTLLAIMNAMNYDIIFNPKYKGGYYGE